MNSPVLRLSAVALTTLTAAFALPSLAQIAPPSAGDTLRDQQRLTPPPPREPLPNLVVPADAETTADTTQRFDIVAVRIDGNRLISTAELQPLVDGLVGRSATLEDLRAAARRITAIYRERGFVVTRAFVPAQRIEGGQVVITVLEGALSSATVQNKSIVSQKRLDAVVAAQRLEGKTIEAGPIDRTLLLLTDLPGVGSVTGLLKPGQAVGTSDLLIPIEQGKAYEGDITADNFGNRYTGQYRLNAHVDVNSPLRIGDRLSLRGTVTNETLLYGRLTYDLPANNNGLRAGVDLSSTYYQLGKEFENLDATGRADVARLFTSYPLVRGLITNVWLAGAVDYRKLRDEVRSTSTVTRKTVTAATGTVYGDHADALLGGGYSTWSVAGTVGALAIDTPAAYTIDQAAPRTSGGYEKLLVGASRLQAIAKRTSVFVSASGQLASKNLDSSEKFVAGGMYGVRAYPQGEAVGDDGWLATVELRQDVAANLQASLFYDAGGVTYAQKQYATGRNHQTLEGVGVGLAGAWRDFGAKASLAWRTRSEAITAPDRTPRLWVSVGWRF